MLGSAKTKLPLLTLTSWVKVPSPFGCWCFHLIKNSSFANLLCCRGGLDWQMVCLFRKPQNGCGVTIFSNNKTKHLTSCCSENLTHKQYIRHQKFYGSFSPFLLLSIYSVDMWLLEISICFCQPSFNSDANLQRKNPNPIPSVWNCIRIQTAMNIGHWSKIKLENSSPNTFFLFVHFFFGCVSFCW